MIEEIVANIKTDDIEITVRLDSGFFLKKLLKRYNHWAASI